MRCELAELKNERRGRWQMCLSSQDSVVGLPRENGAVENTLWNMGDAAETGG